MISVQTFQTEYQRILNFIGFSKGYLRRHNPLKELKNSIEAALKDVLTIHKKIKMSKYRVSYHVHQLKKMESLIASNNEHAFLRGQKLNQVR